MLFHIISKKMHETYTVDEGEGLRTRLNSGMLLEEV